MAGAMSRTECQGFAALVDEYMDGELDPRVRVACEAHVAACPECRRWLARARRAQELLASGPRVEPGRGFRLALRGRLEAERLGRSRRDWVVRSLAAILAPAAVAAVVLIQRMPTDRGRLPDAARVVAAAPHSPAPYAGPAPVEPPGAANAGLSGAPVPGPAPRAVVHPAPRVASRRDAAPRVRRPAAPPVAPGAGPGEAPRPGGDLDSVLESTPAPSIRAPLRLVTHGSPPSYVTPALAQTVPARPAPTLVRPLPAPDGVFAAGRDTTYEV